MYPSLEISKNDKYIIIKNKVFNTTTLFLPEVFNKYDCGYIEKITHQGKNIEYITRVTGYFSKVSLWNKSKKQEFIDRYRVSITKEDL
ncbi:MAG TPA: anaerobic ribonucleoside-triphosphate reductase, partial [Victivallales bacterium]|nr:anaerobic ribonucleoside-triphosphate reductase [Victivallales bacterium]